MIQPVRLDKHPRFRQRAHHAAAQVDIRENYRLHLIGAGLAADSTVPTYGSHLNRFAIWCEEQGVTLLLASEGDVLRHVAETIASHSRSYANTRISFLKSFYGWLCESEQRRGDPTTGLRMKKEQTLMRDQLEPREIQALIEAAETAEEQAVILVLAGSGVRRTELLRITVEDIDWREGVILIHGKGLQQRKVKPGKRALAALAAHLDGQEAGLAFPRGKSTLKRIIDDVADRAGVSNVYPHRFRITSICEMLAVGADTIAVARMHGHSVQMVERYQRASETGRALMLQERLSLPDRLVPVVHPLRALWRRLRGRR